VSTIVMAFPLSRCAISQSGSKLAAPCRFTSETRNALAAIPYAMPRWQVCFGADKDGHEYAAAVDALGDGGATLSVNACRDGCLSLWGRSGKNLGLFATGAELVAEFRRSFYGDLGNSQPWRRTPRSEPIPDS
jgi:hypothetical protein